MRDWADFLRRQLITPQRLQPYFDTVDRFYSGQISYDAFTLDAPANYALALRGEAEGQVSEAMAVFVAEDLRMNKIFPFVQDLLTSLKKHAIEPVIVSGSPQELLERYAYVLGIPHVIGLQLERVDGAYSGRILHNPATYDAKLAIASGFREDIALAIGDTDADYPLLAKAKARIVVGDQISHTMDWPTLRIFPKTDSELEQRAKLAAFLGEHIGS